MILLFPHYPPGVLPLLFNFCLIGQNGITAMNQISKAVMMKCSDLTTWLISQTNNVKEMPEWPPHHPDHYPHPQKIVELTYTCPPKQAEVG